MVCQRLPLCLSDIPKQGCRGQSFTDGIISFAQSSIIKTVSTVPGYIDPVIAGRIAGCLRENTCMVFGHDPDALPLSEKDVASINLDENVFYSRLNELCESGYVFIGGMDADWLFTLGRADIVRKMAQIVRGRGKNPHLLCHYASTVLPAADAMNLDVEGCLAPINKNWSWFDLEASKAAVIAAKKPVIAFMAFACGGLAGCMQEAADFLKEECGVSSVLYGTTKPHNAYSTAKLLLDTIRRH